VKNYSAIRLPVDQFSVVLRVIGVVDVDVEFAGSLYRNFQPLGVGYLSPLRIAVKPSTPTSSRGHSGESDFLSLQHSR
jgi:hypothetical protein